MKYTLTAVFSFLTVLVCAQDIPNKIAIEICNCIDTIENPDSLDAKVDRCAQQCFETVIESASDEVQEIYSTDEAVDETLKKAMESLMTVCPKIRTYVIQSRKATFYTNSSSAVAEKLYESGNELFNKEDLNGALKMYLKALKKDPSFIFALDNAGLTYRKMNDMKNAIRYYRKSLSIYPEGSFALTNLAYAYTSANDYQGALGCYQELAFFYPDDPEGYFGIGKLYVSAGKYEAAMDYVFTAHRIYLATKSEYAKDSQELIAVIHDKLKEQNKLDLFDSKAKEFEINFN